MQKKVITSTGTSAAISKYADAIQSQLFDDHIYIIQVAIAIANYGGTTGIYQLTSGIGVYILPATQDIAESSQGHYVFKQPVVYFPINKVFHLQKDGTYRETFTFVAFGSNMTNIYEQPTYDMTSIKAAYPEKYAYINPKVLTTTGSSPSAYTKFSSLTITLTITQLKQQ